MQRELPGNQSETLAIRFLEQEGGLSYWNAITLRVNWVR